MYGHRFAGLGGMLEDMETNGLISDGFTAAQAAALLPLLQRTPDGFTGNVDPQYANLVMHADGSLGPLTDATNINADNPYWQGIVKANRYLLMLNDRNQAIGTIGAISIPAAAAIMATYQPVQGSTSGQAVSSAATAPAEAAAATESTAAAASAPVAVTAQPYLPPGSPVAATPPVSPSQPSNTTPPNSYGPPVGLPVDSGAQGGGTPAVPLEASVLGGLSPTLVYLGLGVLALVLLGRKNREGQ